MSARSPWSFARWALAVLGLAAVASAERAEPGLRELTFGAKRPALYQRPASAKHPRPLAVFLHGMCALPEWECPVFRGAASDAWLLCPPGPAACEGTGAMWIGTTGKLSRQVDRATEALAEREQVDLSRRALVGYSLGGPAALRVALNAPGRYQRLMFVNASVEPSKATLERAGVTRIAFVAGEADRTAGKLRRAATRLAREGVAARYFSLGKVGHYFDATSEARMRESLAWLTAEW